jgi:thiamine pyrophosphokinase
MLIIQRTSASIEIVHTPDQSKTDLELLITFMKKKIAVNVVWATGNASDHTITNLTIVRYREKLDRDSTTIRKCFIF